MRMIVDVPLTLAEQVIPMPLGSRVLSVSGTRPSLSILCNHDAPLVERTFKIIKTGEVFDETSFKCDYIGSFDNGHVVEVVG